MWDNKTMNCIYFWMSYIVVGVHCRWVGVCVRTFLHRDLWFWTVFSKLGPVLCINAAILAFLQQCLSSRVWTVSPGGRQGKCVRICGWLIQYSTCRFVQYVSFLIIFTPPYLFHVLQALPSADIDSVLSCIISQLSCSLLHP